MLALRPSFSFRITSPTRPVRPSVLFISAHSRRYMATTMDLPKSDVVVFSSLSSYRTWREDARRQGKSVGFVPTMGALHEGHLSLVRRSLRANDLTVVSIFVNPAQFAPHEDLATYPRTLPRDLQLLSDSTEDGKKPSAVFLPSVKDMYPSGITQDVDAQKGTFVEVKGYGHQMEGRSRPAFFRGVATVVTKLFNAVEPTTAYFGQKDIQQALLLRRMCSDLLLSHPASQNVHIVPTARDSTTGLALSSRNAYLSIEELAFAPTLYKALKAAEDAWDAGQSKKNVVNTATDLIDEAANLAQQDGVNMRLDYIEVNDSTSFDILGDEIDKDSAGSVDSPVIISGAVWVGKTRLIDNVLLSERGKILYRDIV